MIRAEFRCAWAEDAEQFRMLGDVVSKGGCLAAELFYVRCTARVATKLKPREGQVHDWRKGLQRFVPEENIFREVDDVSGADSAAREGVNEGVPIAIRVIGHQVVIRGDQGAQVITKGDVDRRAVVNGSDADGQELLGKLRRILGQ